MGGARLDVLGGSYVQAWTSTCLGCEMPPGPICNFPKFEWTESRILDLFYSLVVHKTQISRRLNLADLCVL